MTCPINTTQTDIGCIPDNPAGFASSLFTIGLGLIGGIAVLSIIYGGYILLTSQGNREAIQKGKSYITYAIIGLVFAIGSVVVLQIATVDILQIPGFSK